MGHNHGSFGQPPLKIYGREKKALNYCVSFGIMRPEKPGIKKKSKKIAKPPECCNKRQSGKIIGFLCAR